MTARMSLLMPMVIAAASALEVPSWPSVPLPPMPSLLSLPKWPRPAALEGLPEELKAHGGDPLVDWLAGLNIHLDALEVEKDGFTLTVSDLTCKRLSVERVESSFTTQVGGDPQRPAVAAVISGIGLHCETEYRVTKWGGWLHTHGTLKVDVNPKSSGAKLTLALPLQGKPVPMHVAIDQCEADLDLSLEFSGTILQSLINLFSGLIVNVIKKQANSEGCKQVRDIAAKNMTEALTQLNCLMLPEDEWKALGLVCDSPIMAQASGDSSFPAAPIRALRELSRPAAPMNDFDNQTFAGTPIDLQKVPAFRWGSWFLTDLVGVQGMRKAVQWATRGTGNATVSGGATPIITQRIAQGTTLLDVSVYLKDVGVHGLDGLDSFEPLRARSATELEVELGLGTKAKPDFGVWTHLVLRLTASDTRGLVPPSMVENGYTFSFGLEKPSISTTMKLMLDAAKLQSKQLRNERLLAQWYFDLLNCAKSYLLAAPSVEKLNVTFAGVSEKLAFQAVTIGALEGDLAELINHNVELFNTIYLPYLPSAISRGLGSMRGLHVLNQQLSEFLAPVQCMDRQVAEERAKGVPSIDDWRPLLEGQVRKAIDAVADGFIAQNVTDIQKALKDLPPLHASTNTGTVLTLSMQRLLLEGMNQFKTLRVMLPDPADGDSKALTNRVLIGCPTKEALWRPSAALDATIGARGVNLPGTIELVAPCGSMEVVLDAVVDMPALLTLPVPFPLPCAFRMFSTLHVKRWSMVVNKSGDVFVGGLGHMVSPIDALCSRFPRLCSFATGALKNVDMEVLLDVIRTTALDQCSHQLGDAAPRQGTEEPWFLEMNVSLLIGVVLATAVLAGIGMASSIKLTSGSMLAELYYDGVHGRKLKAYAYSIMAAVSAVLCFAFVLRILAAFILPVAVTNALFDVGAFGEEVETLELITFTLISMVKHFGEAGAFLSAFLLAGGQAISFTVFALLFCVWFTPFFREHRRLLVRIAVWMNRLVFVDVIFFAHIIPVLNQDIELPFQITTRLRSVASSAMYVGGLSNFLTILVCFELLRLQSWFLTRSAALKLAADREQPPSRRKTMLMVAHATSGGMVLVGMVIWFFCFLMTTEFTGLAGTILDPKDYRGNDIFRLTCIGGPFLGACLFLIALLAPPVQAMMPFAVRLKSRQLADHTSVTLLREFGDAFAVPDVVLAGYVAFLMNVDSVARWIGHNKFPELADGVERFGGIEAIGVHATVWWAAVLGMVLGLMGTFGLFIFNAKADIAFMRAAATKRDPASGASSTCSFSTGFSESAASSDRNISM